MPRYNMVPPSSGLESGTGMVRLDMGMDVSWPVPSMLEMLPVLKYSGWKFHKVE